MAPLVKALQSIVSFDAGDSILKEENLKQAYALHCESKQMGFYWNSASQILENVISEATEVREAIEEKESKDRIAEEIGDLYLAVIELCYYSKLNPEVILENSLTKFETRLGFLKQAMYQHGIKKFDSKATDLALQLWAVAKEKAKQKN